MDLERRPNLCSKMTLAVLRHTTGHRYNKDRTFDATESVRDYIYREEAFNFNLGNSRPLLTGLL